MEKIPEDWYQVNRAKGFVNFANYKAFPRVHINIKKENEKKWRLNFFGFDSCGSNSFKIDFFKTKKDAELFAKCLMEINHPDEHYKTNDNDILIPSLLDIEYNNLVIYDEV